MNRIVLAEMLRQMLGRIDRTVLSACATEADHEMAEATSQITLDSLVNQGIDVRKEYGHLVRSVEEVYDGSIATREGFVRLIASRVVNGSAIKDKATPISTEVVGDAATVGEAVHFHRKAVGLNGKGLLRLAGHLAKDTHKVWNLGVVVLQLTAQASKS